MQIKIKTTNIKLTKILNDILERKINSLERLIPHDLISHSLNGRKSSVRAAVEIGKPSLHHRKNGIYYAEIQILLPKRIFRAEAQNWDLKLAINQAKDTIQRQLKKDKELFVSKSKRS